MDNFEHYDDEIDLRRYAAVLWRWKWLLVACTLLAAIGAFVASRLMTPVYEATTTLLVNEAPDSQTSDYNALLMSERLARTYAEMLTQRPVLTETLQRLELDLNLEELEEAIEVQSLRDTQLIAVTVEHENPYTAAEIANTLAAVFQERNDALQQSRFAESKASLERQLARLNDQIEETEAALAALGDPRDAEGKAEAERLTAALAQYQASYTTLLQSYEELRVAEAQTVSNVVQVEPAEPDFEPVRPRTLLNTALAAVVGGMLGLGAVFLIEYLDDSVKTPEQVEQALGLPVLGTIAEMAPAEDGKPHVAAEPRSAVAEAFRALRTNIQFAAVDRPLHTLLITSPGPEEGKSTLCANLGTVMAHGGRQTLVLEADLRRPKVHHHLGLTRKYGLSDLFVQDPLSLDGAVQETAVPGLRAIASGELPPNPAELLGSERMSQILEALKAEADLVLIDTSPASVVTDPVVLAGKVDGVLLVIEPGKTQLPAAEGAVEALRRAGANVIGVVFNNVPLRRAGYYGTYRYQYTYSYEEEDGD